MKKLVILFLIANTGVAGVLGTKKIIITEALRQNVDTMAVLGIAYVESSFRPTAIGDDGRSFGLMQIQMPTAKDMGFKGNKKQLLNPKVNAKYSIRYFKYMRKRTKSIEMALDAYNRGFNAIYHPYKGDWNKHPYVGKIKRYIKRKRVI